MSKTEYECVRARESDKNNLVKHEDHTVILSQLCSLLLIITLLLPSKGLEATRIYVCFSLGTV